MLQFGVCWGLREVSLSILGRGYLSEVVSEFRCRDRETRVRARSQRSSLSFISLILPVSAMVAPKESRLALVRLPPLWLARPAVAEELGGGGRVYPRFPGPSGD